MSALKQPTRVPLTVPIQAHGEMVSSLELRRPKLGDLDGVALTIQPNPAKETADFKILMGDAIPIIAAMARIPPSSARDIDIADVGEVIAAIWDFFAEIPANWPGMMDELAYAYHWPPSELNNLTGPELARWHAGLVRIQEDIASAL